MANETVVVTGVAGFIGSHLSQYLLQQGFSVIGLDSFHDYYPRWIKEDNLKTIRPYQRFTLIEGDLLSKSFLISLKKAEVLKDVQYFFHLAAIPGVRRSWNRFQSYVEDNILVTQRLLDFIKDFPIKKFIFASSSSVYGNSDCLPLKEDSKLIPLSLYGITKLTGEHLCQVYWQNYSVPTVSLRYFTVYGPRQRPDMAFHRFIKAILNDHQIEIFGSGKQTRDFTFISDIVRGTVLATNAPSGEIFNLGGGTRIILTEAVELIRKIIGKEINITWISAQKGDVNDTWADIDKAIKILGYQPEVSLEDGLKEEISWLRQINP